jgi:ubiquinone/menaquinone biosynthesis C-methylase UbiE
MSSPPISFDNAEDYELFMSGWSRLAGEVFLDWIAPAPGLHWLDVGCGNGAFTELIFARCAPGAVEGIDPSAAQVDYARLRPGLGAARFAIGDAMAMPVASGSVDLAVMALVLFFVPEPARGVAEMCRVVRPGGRVGAYAWDFPGGGFPIAVLQTEMREMGLVPVLPPSVAASTQDAMQALWRDAGLQAVETRAISIERRFDDFEAWWSMAMAGPAIAARLALWPEGRRDELKQRVKTRLAPDGPGPIVTHARANAVQGRVPG